MKRLAILFGLVLLALGLLGVSSAATVPRIQWSDGIEPILPTNAAKKRVVFIESVSCPSAGNCSAVGQYEDSSGSREGLLLTEKAGSWEPGVELRLPANAHPKATGPPLDSVSCASAGNCSAVGAYSENSGRRQGLLVIERGGRWGTAVEAALPANAGFGTPAAQVIVSSVSCPSAGNCTAVGQYTDSSGNAEGLLLTETAGRWGTGVEAPLPANAAADPFVVLPSISCPSAGNCSAVGEYVRTTGPGGGGLLLTETAGKWTATEAAVPANGSGGALRSVSCASAGNCSAVGSYASPSNGSGLLLTETAGSWGTGVEAVLPANACPVGPGAGDCDSNFGDLPSISCASAGNCTAVGYYADRSGGNEALLLTETGGKWAPAVEPPRLRGAPEAVSCASAGNCSAVGFGSVLTQTADRWTAAKPTVPANATGGGWFYSVSCASAGRCSAVGSYMDSSGNYHGLLLDSHPLPPCLVPQLKGKTLAAVRRSIRSHSCSIGRIGHAPSQTIEKGHVISQRPKAGKRLQHGARINLVLSSGQ